MLVKNFNLTLKKSSISLRNQIKTTVSKCFNVIHINELVLPSTLEESFK